MAKQLTKQTKRGRSINKFKTKSKTTSARSLKTVDVSGKRSSPPKLVFDSETGEAQHEGDYDQWMMGMVQAAGTEDIDLLSLLTNQAAASCEGKQNAVLAMMHGIAPRDELEGMLVTQMVCTHNLATEFVRRAMFTGQTTEGVDLNMNRIAKLMRTFTSQMEALSRYRGKGQQKVTVEHVHVHEGGQAIVGEVQHRGGGNGKT